MDTHNPLLTPPRGVTGFEIDWLVFDLEPPQVGVGKNNKKPVEIFGRFFFHICGHFFLDPREADLPGVGQWLQLADFQRNMTNWFLEE